MKRRNYGIDLLRIVAMYMIVLYHCLLLGGVINKATQIGIGSINYDISWLLDTLCYCAVNCYALISGYVGVKSKFKLQNIIKLWFQVLFYSVVLNIIIWVTIPNVPIILIFFPLCNISSYSLASLNMTQGSSFPLSSIPINRVY